MVAIEQKMRNLGGQEMNEYNETHGNREGTPDNWIGEKKWMAPDGVAFDINPTGWGH